MRVSLRPLLTDGHGEQNTALKGEYRLVSISVLFHNPTDARERDNKNAKHTFVEAIQYQSRLSNVTIAAHHAH